MAVKNDRSNCDARRVCTIVLVLSSPRKMWVSFFFVCSYIMSIVISLYKFIVVSVYEFSV